MVIPKEREKREGLIGTILFHVILLVFFLIYGLTYTVPFPEEGLLVNFGTTDMGSGEVQPDITGENDTPQPEPVEEVVPTTSEAEPNESTPDVATQDVQDAIAVPKTKTPEEIEAEKAAKKAAEEKAKKEKEQEEFKKKMAQTSNAFNKPNSNSGGGEGPDSEPGDKGQLDGSKEGGAYTGGGSGNGNYSLGDRAALTKPKPPYECQEEGKVVVDIKVDRNGVVKYAAVGKGTTNFEKCLTDKAIEAAYKTKWQAKDGAPIQQKGKITYHFILK